MTPDRDRKEWRNYPLLDFGVPVLKTLFAIAFVISVLLLVSAFFHL